MFGKHVSKLASAYCHDELSPEESRRVAEHLIGCNRCRAEFEEIKLGVKFAEQLPAVSAPPMFGSGTSLIYTATLGVLEGPSPRRVTLSPSLKPAPMIDRLGTRY